MTYIKHQLTKLEEHIASLAINYKLQTRQIGAPIVVCERATVNMRNSLRKRIMIQQQVRDRQHTAAKYSLPLLSLPPFLPPSSLKIDFSLTNIFLSAFDSLMRIRFPHLEPTPKRLRVGPSDSHTIELRTADLITLVDNSISDPRVKQSW
jgi:hypothetical protein